MERPLPLPSLPGEGGPEQRERRGLHPWATCGWTPAAKATPSLSGVLLRMRTRRRRKRRRRRRRRKKKKRRRRRRRRKKKKRKRKRRRRRRRRRRKIGRLAEIPLFPYHSL